MRIGAEREHSLASLTAHSNSRKGPVGQNWGGTWFEWRVEREVRNQIPRAL